MARKNDTPAEGHFGIFEKDGVQVIAYTIDDAVRLRFDGAKVLAEPTNPDANPGASDQS